MRKKNRKQLKEIRLLEKLDLNPSHRLTWRDEFGKHKDNSVKEAAVLGLLEFIPGKERPEFMDELYRVLVNDGKATVFTAYWNTSVGIQDFLYEFPPLCEQSFLFFNKAWREAQNVSRNMVCDFDFTYGYAPTPETQAKSDETRSFAIRCYNNAVQNLQLVLTKRPAA